MSAQLHLTPARATDANGNNLNGAKWFFYQTGTTTPLSVYTTADLNVEHTNPVVADASGKFAPIYYNSNFSYRAVLKTSDEATTIYDIDPIVGSGNGGGVIGLPHFQRLIQKIENGIEDANIVLAGDSTGNETTEWFYLFAKYVASQYPAWTVKHRLWNDGLSTFDAAVTIQTGTGVRTLTFWNGSIAGSVSNRHAGSNFNAVFVNTDADLIFTSYGHNGGAPVLQQLDYYSGLLEKLDKVLPDIPVIVIGQNPTLSDETMGPKVEAFRAMAARRGYGFIDVHAAFKQDGRALSVLLADSVHPSKIGSQLWADTVAASFVSSKTVYGGAGTQESVLLASWSTIQDFTTWARNNVSAPTKDTTNFETEGYSVNLASATAANAWVYDQSTTSADIIALRGKYVTFAVWMRIDPANPDSSGRLEVADSVGSSVSYPTIQSNGFVLHTCTHYVDPSATYLRTYIYPTVEAVSGTVQVDRATLSLGLLPIDIIPARNVSTRGLSLIGSNANGVGVLVNGATSSAGIRGLLDDDDSPATEYVADYAPERIAFKAKADANPTVIVDKTGLKIGDGTGATTLQISLRFTNGFGCTGHWYAQTANTYDLGGAGVEWARVLLNQGVWVAGNQVVSTRGAAVADASGGATVDAEARTAINTLLARLRAHGLIAT